MSLQTESLNALRIDRSRRSRRTLPWALAAIALIGAAGAVGVVWWLNRPVPIEVRTTVVERTSGGRSSIERTLLNASGYITARREATVSSKVTGKVVEVMIEEGMSVEEGQVLARLDGANVQTGLHLAEAQLEASRRSLDETQANLDQFERELERLRQAAAVQAATPLEIERAETDVQSRRARLERQRADVTVAEREVTVWQQQLDDTVIRSPFAGIVTTKNAQPGEMISPMSVGGFTRTGICTVVDMGSLEIEVDVNESYINRIRAGQPVEATLDAYPDWRIPASVIAIIPTADRQKATVRVRVGFELLDPRILPDMSVKVAFQSAPDVDSDADSSDGADDEAPRVTVPEAAVDRRDGRDLVWVVHEGRAERRAVTLGDSRGEVKVVVAGLRGGERVVVDPPADLEDGASVRESRQ